MEAYKRQITERLVEQMGEEAVQPEPETEPAIYLTYEDAVLIFAAAKDYTHVMRGIIDDIRAGNYEDGDATYALGLSDIHDRVRSILRENQHQMLAAYYEKRG